MGILVLYVQDTNLRGQKRRRYIVFWLTTSSIRTKTQKVIQGLICLLVFSFSLNNNSFNTILISIGFLFVLLKTVYTHKIHIVQLRSPRARTSISSAGSVTYSLAFSKNQPSVSFFSRAGLCFVVAQRNPSLPCAQSLTALAFLYHCSFLSLNAIFFIYIRILVVVLFTYVFIHFG